MKRTISFLTLLTICTLSLNTLSAKSPSDGQGISYYRAGFPAVAKPLLISEIEGNEANRAELCFNLGSIYFADNMVDSASYYFNKGLTADPAYSLNAIGLTMLKIKADPVAAETEFKNILKLKQNKKNVDVYLAIANAYLYNNVLDKACIYQEKARSIDKKNGRVYVILGDIEVVKKNIGVACQNYEQAIYFDKNCKEAYIKYARAYKTVNSPLAIEKLNQLREVDPSFKLAERELADVYYSINDFKKAAEFYESYLKSGNQNIQDLTQYAFVLFLSGEFQKSLDVANEGLVREPRNPVFNRLVMYDNVHMKKTAEALVAADKFFNKTDNPKFTSMDYSYYGLALRDSNKIDLAIVQYLKAIEMDSTQTGLWKELSDMYNNKSDYSNSVSAYEKYMKSLPAEKVTTDVILSLGRCYYNWGADDKIKDTEARKSALLKADSVFKALNEKDPSSYRGNFWRARANMAYDIISGTSNAKTYYEQTMTFCEAKADARYNSILSECYKYLGTYYIHSDDNKQALNYWNKYLTLNPNDAQAKQIVDQIIKGKKK